MYHHITVTDMLLWTIIVFSVLICSNKMNAWPNDSRPSTSSGSSSGSCGAAKLTKTVNSANIVNNTVRLSTFEKWNTGGQIGVKSDKTGLVTFIWCKLCAKHAHQIVRDYKLRGMAKEEIQKYITGTSFVTKHNVMRHLNGSAHKAASEYERLGLVEEGSEDTISIGDKAGSGDVTTSTSVNFTRPNKTQPRIDFSLENASTNAYKTLIKAAYTLAVDGLPFSHFRSLVTVLKDSGVKLISKCCDGNKAREFVSFISGAVRQKISEIIKDAKAFSVLSDGSQARKTGSEKELVYVRTVYNGLPKYFCVSLEDIDEYGDANSDNLKKSIDNVFVKKVDITNEDYEKKLVGFTSDGASVNTGMKNGLIKQIKDSRPWLIDFHCILHRIELAMKDSLMKFNQFKDVFEFMTLIYYQFKRSGKLTRHFNKTAEIYDARVLKFPKVHGTRFVSHQRRALHNLLENWTILTLTLEDMIRANKNAKSTAKLHGIIKKLKDYKFLGICIVYLDILDVITELSLSLEKNNILAPEVMSVVEKAISRLEEAVEVDVTADELVKLRGFELLEVPDHLGITTFELSRNSLRRNHARRKEENREFTKVSVSGIKNTFQDSLSLSNVLAKLKTESISLVIDCLKERFSSFNNQLIFKHLFWINPANWSSDISREITSLEWCFNHFKVPLQHSGFDFVKLKSEWKDFKRLVLRFYDGVNAQELWCQIFKYSDRRLQFPNLCLIAEMVLCLGPSNSVVESGFSHLTCLLSDRRLKLRHDSMENLLLIRVNDLNWNDCDRELILETAVKNFLNAKRRKCLIEHSEEVVDTIKLPEIIKGDSGTGDVAQAAVISIDESDSSSDSEDNDDIIDIDKIWDNILDMETADPRQI